MKGCGFGLMEPPGSCAARQARHVNKMRVRPRADLKKFRIKMPCWVPTPSAGHAVCMNAAVAARARVVK